jgi:4,4'-diaponeurosporenoate glycosyltransferase
MMAAGVGAFAIPALRRSSGMFGQCLAIPRAAYDAVGGHEAVKGHTLENLFLSRRLRAAATPVRCCGGRGILDVRMYPHGLGELASGWSKAFLSGAMVTPLPVLSLAVGWLFAAVLVVSMLILTLVAGETADAVSWTVAYVCMAAQIGLQLKRLGTFKWYAYVFYFVPLAFYIITFGAGALKRVLGIRSNWKGRAVDD